MKSSILALGLGVFSAAVSAHPGHSDYSSLTHSLQHMLHNDFAIGIALLAASSVALIFLVRR